MLHCLICLLLLDDEDVNVAIMLLLFDDYVTDLYMGHRGC